MTRSQYVDPEVFFQYLTKNKDYIVRLAVDGPVHSLQFYDIGDVSPLVELRVVLAGEDSAINFIQTR